MFLKAETCVMVPFNKCWTMLDYQSHCALCSFLINWQTNAIQLKRGFTILVVVLTGCLHQYFCWTLSRICQHFLLCISPPLVCGLFVQLAASWIFLWSQAGLLFPFWNVTNRNKMSSKLLVLTVSVSGVTALPIHDKAYKNKYSFWTVCHTMSCWINDKIKFNICSPSFCLPIFISGQWKMALSKDNCAMTMLC